MCILLILSEFSFHRVANKNKQKKIIKRLRAQMQPISPCGRCDFSRMRAWGRGGLRVNKMAFWISLFSEWGYTQICVARGSVSWGSKDNDAAGELQLWYYESININKYCLYASNTEGVDTLVCKVIDVFTLHFQKCTDKIKTLLTKKSKFHFVQY